MTGQLADSGGGQAGTFHRLRRHAIFPLLLYLGLAQLCRDKVYPFSHYPMYSRPSMGEVSFQYVAGPDGPLPIRERTKVTPAQVGKQYNRIKLDLAKAEERRLGRSLDDKATDAETRALMAGFKREAGTRTLEFLREKSRRLGGGRDLTMPLRLMEVTLDYQDGKLTEREQTIAELPAISP